LRKLEKKLKKQNRKKKSIKILKNRPVWFGFGFISKKPKKLNRAEPKLKELKKPSQTEPKPEKLSQNRFEPSQNQKKPSQTRKTEPNQLKPVITLKNKTKTSQFILISIFL
jgi:hypothetical protein